MGLVPAALGPALGVEREPVPAGIRRPTMTFSLRPRRSSLMPRIGRLGQHLVVSWNEAAEMNESVAARPW